MTNYREILRLDSIGLNRTEIAASCGCSRNTVSSTLKRAEECGLSWPLPADLSDQKLAGILYPSVAGKPEYSGTLGTVLVCLSPVSTFFIDVLRFVMYNTG